MNTPKLPVEEISKSLKIQNIFVALSDLKAEPIPIFCSTLGHSKNFVSTGILRREANLIAFAEDNAVSLKPLNSLDNLLNVRNNIDRVKFTDHQDRIYSIDISHCNTLLATASGDHTACIYDLNEFMLISKCKGHLGPIYVAKISHTCEYLATGSADHTARLWEVATGKTLRVFVAHTAQITCLDFHPNGLYISTGSADRNIRMWCLSKAVTLRLLQGSKALVLAITYSPTGKYLASVTEDRKVRIWDLLTSKDLLDLKCDGAPIYKLIWDKTGREVCAGSSDATITIWDLGMLQDSDWEEGRQHEPNTVKKLPGRLLNLEYAFGTYGALTVME